MNQTPTPTPSTTNIAPTIAMIITVSAPFSLFPEPALALAEPVVYAVVSVMGVLRSLVASCRSNGPSFTPVMFNPYLRQA